MKRRFLPANNYGRVRRAVEDILSDWSAMERGHACRAIIHAATAALEAHEEQTANVVSLPRRQRQTIERGTAA